MIGTLDGKTWSKNSDATKKKRTLSVGMPKIFAKVLKRALSALVISSFLSVSCKMSGKVGKLFKVQDFNS